jgi:hypothetical protein
MPVVCGHGCCWEEEVESVGKGRESWSLVVGLIALDEWSSWWT